MNKNSYFPISLLILDITHFSNFAILVDISFMSFEYAFLLPLVSFSIFFKIWVSFSVNKLFMYFAHFLN